MLQFPSLGMDCNIFHFITTRHGGISEGSYASLNLGEYCGDIPSHVRQNREKLAEVIGIESEHLFTPNQTHDSEIKVLNSDFIKKSRKEQQLALHGIDALVTDLPGIALSVTTADCVPILLYVTDKQVVASIHAGWRGTVKQITGKTVRFLQEYFDYTPDRIHAGIGPAIGIDAYEVGEEVVEKFSRTICDLQHILRYNPQTGKAHINLQEANRRQLLEAGLSHERIETAPICTYSRHTDFFFRPPFGYSKRTFPFRNFTKKTATIMIHVSLSDEITTACPDIHILTLFCKVKNSFSNESLWKEIEEEEKRFRAATQLEGINKKTSIQATRQVYKRLGKDPNRYRPSAESLCRRIIRGLPLYQVDTLVDLINLISIRSGYSIGGFDATKIKGKQLILGVGQEGEPYNGIGRGTLNIEGLPVYRDQEGGIGTPTSDEERTKIGPDTDRLFMIINGYSGKKGLLETGAYAVDLLKRYASATDFKAELIHKGGCERISITPA